MSSDLIPFARVVEHAKLAGRGADLYLECGHKMTVAGDQRNVKAIPCSKCVAAFHEEQDRRRIDKKLMGILQECRSWMIQTTPRPLSIDVLRRLDESLETLRARIES